MSLYPKDICEIGVLGTPQTVDEREKSVFKCCPITLIQVESWKLRCDVMLDNRAVWSRQPRRLIRRLIPQEFLMGF